MGKLWIKIHLGVREGEEECRAAQYTGQSIQEQMDILYSDIMHTGDTMIIRVTDDDKSYVFYQRADGSDPVPYALVTHVFSLKREAGRKALLCAIGNATDRIDPNIRGLIYGDAEATRYMFEKTAFEVKANNPKDAYVRDVNKLLKTASDREIIEAIKSVTFFVQKIKLVEENEEFDEPSHGGGAE